MIRGLGVFVFRGQDYLGRQSHGEITELVQSMKRRAIIKHGPCLPTA